jgi:ankyrin repeat protein
MNLKRIIFSIKIKFSWYYYLNMHIFSLLKLKGIDVNKRHQLGWTPLLVAVINKNIE